MISRSEASEVIYDVINSGIISDELEMKLQEIANCIEAEENWGIHAWNMPDDEYGCLCTSMRTDLPEYKDFLQKQVSIAEKYSFVGKEIK